ncbi:MAG: hypothetical protein INQ03_23205 [Candidatus Heimdallarchaeota archaeon]|nr:hypothetical protein [Candidatus Heimdallarchaeota archaeon]
MRRVVVILIILLFLQTAPTHAVEVNVDVNTFIDELITRLLDDVEYNETGHFIGWKDRLYTKDNQLILYQKGYTVGAAGIADVLLSYYDQPEVKAIVDQTANFLVTTTVPEDIGVSWDRFSTFRGGSYLGLRYGTMGIIKFLTHYYQETQNTTILETINLGLEYFYSQEESPGFWRIGEGEYITTYYEYGLTGMGDQFLELYDVFEDEIFITKAKNIANLIINLGVWKGAMFELYWDPEYVGSIHDEVVYASMNSGVSGVMGYLLDLYDVTGNSTYLDVAIGLGNTLVELEINGAFEHAAIGYISGFGYKNKNFVGYTAGSAGVASSLFRLYEYSPNSEFIQTCANIETYVNSMNYDNGSVSIGQDYIKYQFTGMDLGGIGLIMYYAQLYERYGLQEYIDRINNLLNHLHELWVEYDYIPVDENHISIFGFSYNIEKGLAGLILALQQINSVSFDQAEEDGYIDALDRVSFVPTDTSTEEPTSYIMVMLPLLFPLIRKSRQFTKTHS